MALTRWRTMHRIEPDPRDTDPAPGAAVPLGDPLWMLGRQWWMGEMDFVDGGTPVAAEITLTESRVSAPRAGIGPERTVPSARLAEGTSAHWRDRLRMGHALVARAEAAGLGADMAALLAEHCPLTESHPLVLRMAPRRRIDGAAALRLLRHSPEEVPETLVPILEDWARDQSEEEPRRGFDADRRAHEAVLDVDGNGGLYAHQAPGPALHWSDLTPDAGEGAPRSETRPLARTSLPGEQPPRWWRFEDDGLDWTAAPAGPSDLGQLLVAAAFAEQGQVLWRCEVDVPINSLVRIADATVRDTFGHRRPSVDARSQDLRGWAFEDGRIPVLATAPMLEGDLLEAAVFRTDNVDNLGWLEETVVRRADGRGEAWTPGPRHEEAEAPRLVLRASPPESWIAYAIEAGGLVATPLAAAGGGLRSGRTRFFRERYSLSPTEIGGRGFRYELRPMLARAPSGHRIAWQVATARPGPRPGSSSGLLHDLIQRPSL